MEKLLSARMPFPFLLSPVDHRGIHCCYPYPFYSDYLPDRDVLKDTICNTKKRAPSITNKAQVE
jgi:hypothetical protein